MIAEPVQTGELVFWGESFLVYTLGYRRAVILEVSAWERPNSGIMTVLWVKITECVRVWADSGTFIGTFHSRRLCDGYHVEMTERGGSESTTT